MQKVGKFAGKALKTLMFPLAVYIIFFILSKFLTDSRFGNWDSINIILQQAVLNAMIGWSMSFNMVNGRWDFSIGSMVMIVGIIGGNMALDLDMGAHGILLFCLIFGVLFGLINAACQILIGAPTLVTSFGLLMVYETMQAIVNDGLGVRIMGSKLPIYGMYPRIFIVGIIFALIHYIVYTYTRFGHNTRSLAYNVSVAKNIGISEKKNILGCYILCGLFAGMAAVIYASSKGSVQLSMNMTSTSLVFEAMIPVFLGIFISRYSNLTIGIYIGSVTVKLLISGLMSIGLSSTWQSITNGLVLFAIIAYSVNEERIKRFFSKLFRKTPRADAAGAA